MEILLLGREEVRQVLTMKEVLQGVEDVYRMKARGETVVWPLVSHDFTEADAVMDIRSGYVQGAGVHGLKMLNNFPHNAERGLPPFTGMLMVFDSATGIPLGVLDAAYITCMRTGAAGALGAKALARPDSRTLLLLGAGNQSIYQIAATLTVLPKIDRVYIADPLNADNARAFAMAAKTRLAAEFGLDAQGVEFLPALALDECVAESDIIITVTRARNPVIQKEWVKPGTHFSCIGADMEGKEEIDPELFRDTLVYADDKAQCMRVGEMEIPLQKGIITPGDVAGELGQLLEGELPGRTSPTQTTIFDATGLALLDLVSGKAAIEGARKLGLGTSVAM